MTPGGIEPASPRTLAPDTERMPPPSARSHLAWDDLRLLLTLAERGSFSAAAQHLGISHPTVSRRLREAERRLGCRLVERLPTGLQLTTAGADVQALALRMNEEIAALERRIRGRDERVDGVVRLTAPDAVAEYLLPGMLARLCQEQTGLAIELQVANQLLSLAQREADIALRVTAQPSETLKGRRVGTVAMAVYAAPSLRLPAEVLGRRGLPWVGFDASLACSGPGQWLAAQVDEQDIRLRANTLLGAAQAVRAGIGCGVLPCFVGGSMPELRRLSEPLPALGQPLWLLVHPEMAAVPRIRRASDALAAQLRRAAPLLTGHQPELAMREAR